jgi:hypothetical protein
VCVAKDGAEGNLIVHSPTAIEAEAQFLMHSHANLPFCNWLPSAGDDDQDTDDEEHSANAEIEDEFLKVLDHVTLLSPNIHICTPHLNTHTHANPDA